MTNFESVKTFMKTFGQEVKEKAGFPSDKITSLRYELIYEELEELKEAISKARRIIRGIQNGEEFTREGINEVLGIYKDSGGIGRRSTLVSGIGSDRDGHS